MSLYGSLMGRGGGGGGGGFEEDPIFGSASRMMGQMDSMMSSMMQDPFGSMLGGPMMGMGGMGALMGAPMRQPQQQQMALMGGNNMNALNLMANPMTMMNTMMSNMDQMRGESTSQVFSSSSVMSMTTGPDGRPQIKMANKTDGAKNHTRFEGGRATKVYQSSTTSRGGPGGVRETQHAVSDSSTGVRKLAIGHHIGDRARIVEKERNRDGEEEREELLNLDEEEADEFESEFRRATSRLPRAAIDGGRSRNSRAAAAAPPLAIESGRSSGGRGDRYDHGADHSSYENGPAPRYESSSSNPAAPVNDRYSYERVPLHRSAGIDVSNFDRRPIDRTGLDHIEYHRPNVNYTPLTTATNYARPTSYTAGSYSSRPFRTSALRRPVSSTGRSYRY